MTDSLRPLKFLVIAMGVVIVIGTIIVVVTIVQRASTKSDEGVAAPSAAAVGSAMTSAPQGFGVQTLDIPRGARIAEMVAEGDRLIVRLDLAGGARQIVVLDTATGKRLGTFEVRETP